jgi:transcriptional regulator with XRE-family HTH domain
MIHTTEEASMALTITMEELGEELRRRRDEGGLSLRDVEEATGVSAATLSRIERGSTPDLEIVTKLAQWLGVVVHAGGNERTPKDSDEELKRTIEVHLRANKKLPPNLARTIADSFDFVMRVEMERAAAKKKR